MRLWIIKKATKKHVPLVVVVVGGVLLKLVFKKIQMRT